MERIVFIPGISPRTHWICLGRLDGQMPIAPRCSNIDDGMNANESEAPRCSNSDDGMNANESEEEEALTDIDE